MDEVDRGARVRRIALLGNHLPRQCGIATFTTDLANALEDAAPDVDRFVVAMNAPGAAHTYPPRVRFEVAEGDVSGYRRAADFLHVNGVDVLSIQHEYGIFGPRSGANVLELVRDLRVPIVTTLHTIVAAPTPSQRAVMDALVERSERLVVMSADGAALLHEVHGVDPERIDLIPHGIPLAPERQSKDRLGVEGRSVILTFGLLSPDKGIEHVIDAMPAILSRHPDTVYVVLGATHPHVKERHGEAYRHMLESRAQKLGVEGNLVFHDRFVSHAELVELLGAADIYVTPYLKEEQSTSGTLAYAVGCGKAVVSTPYRYARELLADGRGVLVPWRDAGAIAREIVALLDDPARRFEIQQRAAAYGRSMTWPIVARRYLETFERAAESHARRRERAPASRSVPRRPPEPPALDLTHVRLMTDDTGMLQHATYCVPRYEDGYCTDDNARALLLMALVEESGAEPRAAVRALSSRYLAFLAHALDERTGRFRNFLTYGRAWVDAPGSDDSHGRALWGLGAAVARTTDASRKALAAHLFRAALPEARRLGSPRAWAYTLLGIDGFRRAFPAEPGLAATARELAERLLTCLRLSSGEGWTWFEDRLTYCNARLPQALFLTSAWLEDAAMRDAAARSLAWLGAHARQGDGTFSPVGSDGFHVRGGERATFDQQPVEACAMVSACLDAQRLTGDPAWGVHARRAFDWFLGENALRLPVYDAATGGCRDGLHADRPNENQGAESTLSFLLAVAETRAADRLATEAQAPVRAAPASPAPPASRPPTTDREIHA